MAVAGHVVRTLSPRASEEESTLLADVLADELRRTRLHALMAPRVLASLRVEFSKAKTATLTIREGEDVSKAISDFESSHSHLLQHNARTANHLMHRRVSALLARSALSKRYSTHVATGDLKLHGICI